MMNIRSKFHMDYDSLTGQGPITIVAFGDSVTHGALGFDENGREYFGYETVYWNRLRRRLQDEAGSTPVNVINAGIAGASAAGSLARMERQVLAHHPDLVIVCFGLNDVNGPLEEYVFALKEIFSRCLAAGSAVIFMTPNMLNTRVAGDTHPRYRDYAAVTAQMQNSGRMDAYMDAARAAAKEMGVPVCDCYAGWKELAGTEDVTMLLANRINHPSAEMHELFAERLFQMIMEM